LLQKCSLLGGQKALEEVMQVDRVFDYRADIQLFSVKVDKALHRLKTFLAAHAATKTVK